jgi:hypothetical protein
MTQDDLKKTVTGGGAIAGVLYGPVKAGAEDDFYNRFLLQNTNIRSFVIPKEKRLEFDQDYDAFLQNLLEAKIAKANAIHELARHREEIATGKDGIVTGHQLNVNKPIDDELNLFFKDFFIRGTMATEGLRNLLNKWFGYNIAFLFTDDEKKFNKGSSAFKLNKDDPRFLTLSGFIKTHRDGWYRSFKDLRDKIEHRGFHLPRIKHIVNAAGKVEIIVPKLGDQTLEDVLEIAWNNLSNLCEETYIFIASLELKKDFIIWKIPEEKRGNHNWARFKVAVPEFPEANVSTS